MQGDGFSERRTLEAGETLVEQGEPRDLLFLLLDGVFAVEIDGEEAAEIGPGAIVGEGSAFADGRRTATLRACTRCRVAPIPAALVEWEELEGLAAARRT